MRPMTLRHGWPGLLLLVLAGCSHAPPPAYPDWGRRDQPIRSSTADPVFAAYTRAAVQAETDAAKYADRVVFTPDQRKAMQAAISQPVSIIRAQTGKPVEFDFKPRPPFAVAPYQKGWRLIGRSMIWDIQASGEDLDKAITAAVQATGFGFGLSSGGATDASLGLMIADDARRALVDKLGKMSPAQLDRLANGMQAVLATKPTLQQAIDNEHEQMLAAVKAIQDAYVQEHYEDLKVKLGPDVRDAITYLQDMHSDDARKRPAYFEKLAAEADAEVDWLQQACLQPAAKRQGDPMAKSEQRPWRKFSKQFFRTCRPLLSMNDSTLARTRLLILTCRIEAETKRTGSAPKELGEFPARLRQDPYSGLPFVYRADGPDYFLYSVGADLTDDGGQTDETFTTPDLLLERAKK